MTIIERIFAPRGTGARLANRSWLGARMRASAIAVDGFTWDGATLPRPPEDGRAYLVFPIEGVVHLVDAGCAVALGSGVVFASNAASFDERVVILAPHRSLALRIDRALVRAPRRGEPFVADRHAVLSVYDAIERGSDVAFALRALLHVLRVRGILLADARASDSIDGPEDPAVARALTRALTFDASRPAMIDFEDAGLALSERHARRRVDAFLRRHRMPFARWRDMRQSFNLTGAALALSLRDLSTDDAARMVGLASPSSLCHTLKRAGLAPPREIARSAQLARARFGP